MAQTNPIERAIAEAGSEMKLGELTGYSQVAINKAKRAGKCTSDMAMAIAAATSVPLRELIPDVAEAVLAEFQRGRSRKPAAALS
jgi:hypothetical protein